MKIPKGCIAPSVVVGLIFLVAIQSPGMLSAQESGVPYPDATTPKPIDVGPLVAHAASPITVTVALRLRSLNEAESLMTSLHTPGNSQFHHFLSPSQFRARFGPAPSDVAKVISQLAAYSLSAKQTSTTTLRVTGSPANMERAFAVNLHAYQVPAHGHARAYTFHAPLAHGSIPSEMAGSVAAVIGLDSRPAFRPHNLNAPKLLRRAPRTAKPATTGNPPGLLTVTDFANLYDVQPLYQQGVTGQGHILGIVTLASFTPSDAFAYWSAVGLSVDPNRIQIVNVDGGPGAPSDASGSIETTLDVEQSGGVAPGAKIIVYQAPNSGQGYVDAFAAAIDNNSADSVSTSWGFWEWFAFLSTVMDPTTGQSVNEIQAFHELFLQAAIQGQTLFAASGDGGAYDVNENLGCSPESPLFTCNLTLSVDHPASDPAITAAGGTTLPGLQEYCIDANCTQLYQINVPNERVWGWDYLDGFCGAIGISDPIACGIFPGGSGGGVSILFARPDYQETMPGLRHSEQHQSYAINGKLIFNLPGNYVGRNVPDISFNADPQTGYQVYYTSDTFGFGIFSLGGTSLVAPQLNGVTALFGQSVNGRIGLLNYPLYALAHGNKGYKGSHPSLRDISEGDNWFYYGRNAYSQGAGLGTLDVANFALYLRGLNP